MTVLGTRVTVATTATLLAEATTAPVPAQLHVPTGGATVYYGGSGVTTSTGFAVDGGASVSIDLEVGESIYGIVSASTQVVHVLEQIPAASASGWGFILDPTSEDAANTQLSINDGSIYRAFSPLGLDPPEAEHAFVSSADVEGAIPTDDRYPNREISIGLRVYGSSAANLAARVTDLQQKVDKITREGGTLKITSPSGAVRIFDLVSASAPVVYDNSYMANSRAEVELKLGARPFSRGAEVAGTDKAETTLPVVIQIDTGPDGEVPANGRLVIDEDDADNRAWVAWGIESRYFDETDPATKKLFYQAEDLYATGGSAAATGPSGASGSASNKVVTSAGLIPYYTQILSMKASTVAGSANGSGSYPAHVGTFRAFARVQVPSANVGELSLRLEWGEGDFSRFTENAPYVFEADSALEGAWVLIDLGLVSLTKVLSGTQQWDGRIAASSTIHGDTIHVDYIALIPVAEGSGQAFAVNRASSSSVGPTARDDFDGSSIAALAGQAPDLPAASTWTGAGDGTDLQVTLESALAANQVAQRTEVSDASTVAGRFERCGTGTATNVVVSARITTDKPPNTTTGERWCGVFARYSATTDWLFGGIKLGKDGKGRYRRAILAKRVSSTLGILAQGRKKYTTEASLGIVTLSVDTAGRIYLSANIGPQSYGTGGDPYNILNAQHADLATGGALATGGYGLYDMNSTSVAATRKYDDFVVQATAITADAAVYASQSLEIRHDRVLREDSAGALWIPPGRYEGDFVRIPCAGNEGRSYRWIVLASRGRPGVEPDSAIDDTSARMYTTSRWLGIGE